MLGLDPASDKSWTLLDGAAIVAAGTQVLEVGPELDDATNTVARSQLPGTIRVSVAHTDATSITRTISVQLVG